MIPFTPTEIFLTKGVGYHNEKLASFEDALRDARIAKFNLVTVSSILPPHCRLISLNKGLARLKSGQIVYCVMSHNETNENRRLIASAIGLAIPTDRNQYGYLSEHHSFGETDTQTGEYAEDLAASMLATILGLDFERGVSWDQRRKIWRMSGKFVKTTHIAQSAIGRGRNIWTTVVAAAIFVT